MRYFAKQRMLQISKDDLLATFEGEEKQIENINKSKTNNFMFCRFCGGFVTEPQYSTVPNEDTRKKSICWKPDCLERTRGTKSNLDLKAIDEKWVWICSDCQFTYDVPKNYLKKTYATQQKSFILSPTKKRKDGMDAKEQAEASAFLGGTVTSKVDEREFLYDSEGGGWTG